MGTKLLPWIVLAGALLLVSCAPPGGTSPGQNASTAGQPTINRAGPELSTFAGNASLRLGPGVPAEFKPVAATSVLQLDLDPATSQIAVEDYRDARVWLSRPDKLPTDKKVSAFLLNSMQSVFILHHTDQRQQFIQATSTASAKPAMHYVTLPDGIRVHYDLGLVDIHFALEFRVKDDSLEVSLPPEDFTDGDTYRTTTIEVLPYFGAAPDDTRGSMLVPDGAGAAVDFQSTHPEFKDGYSARIYGEDKLAWHPQVEDPSLPVFGMLREGSGFLGIVDQGEFDTTINASPAGYLVNDYRIGPEFIIRRFVDVPTARTKTSRHVERDSLREPRSVRYVFVDGSRATYAGLAQVYREFLARERGVPRLAAAPPPLNVRIFLGAEQPGLVGNQVVTVTSFDQARQIVEAIRARGVPELTVTLVGWNHRGYGGDYPNRFPVEAAFGGEAGLRNFVAAATRLGVPVYLEDDYVDADYGWRTFIAQGEVARQTNGLPYELQQTGQNTNVFDVLFPPPRNWMVLNPRIAFERYATRDLPTLASFGVRGLFLRHLGDKVLSDANTQYPLDRAGFARSELAIARLAREKLGWVGSDGGNAYVLGQVDYVAQAPLTSSGYWVMNETVPFYELVVHGLVAYSGQPANLQGDQRRDFLRQIEYGALPTFELSYDSPAALERTAYTSLYASRYTDWLDDVAREYRAYVALRGLSTQFMTDHRLLAPDVSETRYEDGTRIVVNYTDAAYTVDGVVVPPLDFAVIGR